MATVVQKHIDAAKADGRWDAAHACPADDEGQVPPDLRGALEARARRVGSRLGEPCATCRTRVTGRV